MQSILWARFYFSAISAFLYSINLGLLHAKTKQKAATLWARWGSLQRTNGGPTLRPEPWRRTRLEATVRLSETLPSPFIPFFF
jgi:hypothetical protein